MQIQVWIRECEGIEELTTRKFDSKEEAVGFLTPTGHDENQEGEWNEEGYVYQHEEKTYTISHLEYEITNVMTSSQLCGEHGETFGLYRDGSFATGDSVGDEIAENERPIICVGCTGISNLDLSYYSNGWATWDTHTYDYVVDETGEHISEEEMLSRCVSEGDGNLNEELAQMLIRAGE